MRLTALTIKNFKGIDERGCRIEFSPITLLFGPNNAGKSTIIQALHLAQEILCSPAPDYDRIDEHGAGLDLGSFKDYVHKHDLNRKVSIGIEVGDISGLHFCGLGDYPEDDEIWGEPEIYNILNNVENIAIEFGLHWNFEKKQSELESYTIFIDHKHLVTINLSLSGNNFIARMKQLNVSRWMDKAKYKSLLRDADKIWELIDSEEDDSSELHDLADKALDAMHPMFQAFASVANLVEDVTGSDELGTMAAEYRTREISFPIPNLVVSLWGDRLPGINYTSFDPLFEEVCVDGAYRRQSMILFQSFMLSPIKWGKLALSELIYIGPLREIPERGSTKAKKISAHRWASGLAAWDLITSMTDDQIQQLNTTLAGPNSMNTGYVIRKTEFVTLDTKDDLIKEFRQLLYGDFKPEAIPLLRRFLEQKPSTRLLLQNISTGVEVELHDMGTGISQVLPCLVSSISAQNGQLVAIEQPELHIHPAWQTALADVFISAIGGKDNPPLFLLETHSEHLLLRLLRRIKQTNLGTAPENLHLKPENLAIYWIGSHDNQTEIYPLEIDEEGSFTTPWPEGFFEERAEELFG